MSAQMPADLATAAQLGGQMGRRFAEYDWASHPLGTPSGWAPEVRALVAVALTSRFPIVLWLGSDDLFLVYNDAYLSVLGDKHPAALGRPGRQVWWDIWEQIGPMLSGVVSSGAATWSDNLMLPLVTEGRAQERFFTFSYGPIVLASGHIDGVFCAVTETTERVLSERRLHLLNAVAGAVMQTRTVEQATRAMVQACGDTHPDLPFIAVYLDEPGDGHRLRAASSRVAGRIPDRLPDVPAPIGDHIAGRLVDLNWLVPAVGAAPDEPLARQALVLPLGGEAGSGQGWGHLVIGINPLRPVDAQYGAFCRLLADQMVAALVAADSYQQQQQRAEALAELDRAKTAFLTNVSHEFRTPLTLILGPLQDAISAAGEDTTQRDRLNTSRRNAQRLLRLVDSLLEFSRIEAGRPQLSRQPVNLGAITAQIASSFAGLCERAGIDLLLDCAPVTAAVDVDMWETIVLNLLSNAVKFTYAGAITVMVDATGDGARLRIADTGSGIAAADLDKIFERFYRASNTHGRSVEGSGIGLSLVRSLVDLHGATINLDSAPGEGTTVTIQLPPPLGADDVVALDQLATMTDETDNPFVAEAMQWLDQPRPPAGPVQPDGADRAVILIADDNADMRAHLERILSPSWATIAVADGRTALAAIHEHHPDLLITDVMMPGVDGFALTRAVRDDPDLAEVAILMLSARAGTEAAGDGFASGADDYLVKPFSSAQLVDRVKARLQAAARQRDHRARGESGVRHKAATAEMLAGVSAAETIPALLSALVAEPLEANSVAVAMLDVDDDQHLTVHYAGDIDPELAARYHRLALGAPVPIAHVVATNQPMVTPDTGLLDARFDQAVKDAAPGIQASVAYPLHDSTGSVIGGLALLWPQPTIFPARQLSTIAQAAAATGQTLARIRLAAQEHRIATDFQEHLLDLDRGCTDVAVAACYQPATEAMRVGGDWYVTTPLGHGRVSVSVGDVIGHGLPAATVMGRLRAVVAATALADADPQHVLTNVQRYADTVAGARSSTLAYATLDTTTSSLDYLCAGHPYPLLVTADGETRFLKDGRMPPLAAFHHSDDLRPGHATVPTGSLLILYTDGLIERRGESVNDGFARLAIAALECATKATDAVCSTLLRRLRPPGGYTDDVVILALRPSGITDASWIATVPAAAAQLTTLRHQLREWLAKQQLDANLHLNILISVGEAIANALEHGSGLDAERTISIEAFATRTEVSVAVRDTGQWRGDSAASHRGTDRGRGLTLIHGLADRVDIVRTPRGSTVSLRFHRPEAVDAPPGARS